MTRLTQGWKLPGGKGPSTKFTATRNEVNKYTATGKEVSKFTACERRLHFFAMRKQVNKFIAKYIKPKNK